MTFLRSLLAIFLVLPLAACALSGEAIEGQVLEEGTNQPIAGAIVVVRWQGRVSSFVDSQGVCYHVETATTDEQGRYQTKSWSQPQDYLVSFDHIAVDAYKPGYGFPDKLSRVQEVEYLAPFRGSREERLAYLERKARGGGCNSAGETRKNLYPLYEALYYEAKLQRAPEKTLQWFRRMSASQAIAGSESRSQLDHDESVGKFLHENLK